MAEASEAVRILDRVVGWSTDHGIAQRLHELRHRGIVDYVELDVHDIARRRLRVTSDAGVGYAIALPRTQTLGDGAVLLLEADRAVVVRAGAPQTLALRARNCSAALRLGFLAGHLHWRIDQRDDVLVIRLEGPATEYISRVSGLLDGGQIELADD